MESKIAEALACLKDFQKKTVEYVYEQLYMEGRDRFLVADEVGLGKTIVAKGIIAKAFKKHLDGAKKKTAPRPFNVVYICSSNALALQNLRKLNLTKNEKCVQHKLDRLPYLLRQPTNENAIPFRISSLTPGTSLNPSNAFGKKEERAMIHGLLRSHPPLAKFETGLSRLLQANCPKTWATALSENSVASLRKDVPKRYLKSLTQVVDHGLLEGTFEELALSKPMKFLDLVTLVCERLQGRRKFGAKKEVVALLRQHLIRLGLKYLKADIFILDEFQRFNSLIKPPGEDETMATELAREVFSLKRAKVLLLSATPFKPFTTDFDEAQGEVHSEEFKNVLRFLRREEETEDHPEWQRFEKDQRKLFSLLSNPAELASSKGRGRLIRQSLEGFYRQSLVRTERFLVSNDRNALTRKGSRRDLDIGPEDIESFVALDRVVRHLSEEHKAELPIPVEYAKSSPFPLSFLDNYQVRKKLDAVRARAGSKALLRKTTQAWLDFDALDTYEPILGGGCGTGHAKLRLLLDQAVQSPGNNGWQLLWIPPTLPYYEFGGAFKGNEGYSKTLVFSAWQMVPRMISTVVSYEAERLAVENQKSFPQHIKKPHYFTKTDARRFTFKMERGKAPEEMNSFALIYPCMTLAELYDPATNLRQGAKKLAQIRVELRKKIEALFDKHRLLDHGTGRGPEKTWYWMAPLLLDGASEHAPMLEQWLKKGVPPHELTVNVEVGKGAARRESAGKKAHFDYAARAALDPESVALPKLTDKQFGALVDYLVEYTLAAPAVCALRTIRRYYEYSGPPDAAFNIALALLALLNKPESLSIVRIHSVGDSDWRKALSYFLDGNLQAMLDEFVYLLKSCEDVEDISKLANLVIDILGTKSAGTNVDGFEGNNIRRKWLRTHFAADFKEGKISTASGENRRVNLRQAFNSPFRPFVLATTSIGQEGLDFHYYCKKIIHWNLPRNPIDFEQRIGRINRYKGLVIRQNLTHRYATKMDEIKQFADMWEPLFAAGAAEKYNARFSCDLVPFWHLEPEEGLQIESFVPLYPLSSDIERYDEMAKVLAYYRLTLGQPRQEELVEALGSLEPAMLERLDDLMVWLSPIYFMRKGPR